MVGPTSGAKRIFRQKLDNFNDAITPSMLEETSSQVDFK